MSSAIAMMMAVFFTCGFLATLNDVLVPHLKLLFTLSYFQVMFVQFSFFSAFFLFSWPSGKLLDRIGFKKAIVVGLATMSLGAVLFLPAASVPSFPLFMFALIVLAAGDTCLQVSGNPYVLRLGSPAAASSRLNLAQAFNSLGSTCAPYFGGLFIFKNSPLSGAAVRMLSRSSLHAYRLQEAKAVKLPYLGIAACLATVAFLVARLNLPNGWRINQRHPTANPRANVWGNRTLLLGALGIFLYVGAEISIGSFLINYLGQKDIGGLTMRQAAVYVSVYWAGAMVGRFGASVVLRKVSTGRVVSVSALAALVLVITSVASFGAVASWSIVAVGLFNSVLFPGLFSLGIEDFGGDPGTASGTLMGAAVGGAIIPVLQGALADHFGVHVSFALPACCYVYVVIYASGFFSNRNRLSTETLN